MEGILGSVVSSTSLWIIADSRAFFSNVGCAVLFFRYFQRRAAQQGLQRYFESSLAGTAGVVSASPGSTFGASKVDSSSSSASFSSPLGCFFDSSGMAISSMTARGAPEIGPQHPHLFHGMGEVV
jgi:hypothetical protein